MLKKDPSCSFRRLMMGTQNWYRAVFSFDENWNGFAIVAEFQANNEDPIYMPVNHNICMIPNYLSNYNQYSLRLIGQKNSSRIVTNNVKITQNGGDK